MDTLVLDRAYAAVGVVSWQRAMTLLFEQKVEVVEEYSDRSVRTVSVEFKMPSVIRFLHALKGTKRAIKFSRENLYSRDKGRCSYCGLKVPRHEATYDHVLPRAQGGQTRWENIVICCLSCNNKKGNRTPEQARMKLLVTPHKPKSLPGVFRMSYRRDMPMTWKQFLVDAEYWHGEVEHEE